MVSLRYAGTALPAAGMCISPWVDLTCSGLSYQTRVAPRHRTLGLCSIFLLSVRSGVMATSREMLLTAGGGPRNRRPGHRDRGSTDRKSTRLNSSHGYISYAVFCLKKKKKKKIKTDPHQ